MSHHHSRRARLALSRATSFAALLALTVGLAGCASVTGGLSSLVGASPDGSMTADQSPLPGASEADAAKSYWASAYAKNPRDEKAAIGYAHTLKSGGDKAKALSLLQQAAMYNPDSLAIAGEEGRLALDMGQTDLAQKLLTRANDPSHPDWRTLNALGTLEAQRGNREPAKAYFEKAQALAPSEPSVLNNLALAYALSGDAPKAEELLKKAAAAGGDVSKVRQNLALVLGVQGKFGEAQQVASTDLDKAKADANVAYLQKMVKATPIAIGKQVAAKSQEPAAQPVAAPADQATASTAGGGADTAPAAGVATATPWGSSVADASGN